MPIHAGLQKSMTALLGRLLGRMLAVRRVREAICWRLLEEPSHRASLTRALALQQAGDAPSFDEVPDRGIERIECFEDCYWLFSSNELNMGISQLQFDEAACLFRLLRGSGQPRVVELGRYRGGTTFLMAAAGARVISLEASPEVEERFREPLMRALRRFGLEERVELVLGDAHTCPVEPEASDFVLMHCSPATRAEARAIAAHWWPGIRPGGGLILHGSPYLPAGTQLIGELDQELDAWNAERIDLPAGEHTVFRKRAVLREPTQVNAHATRATAFKPPTPPGGWRPAPTRRDSADRGHDSHV